MATAAARKTGAVALSLTLGLSASLSALARAAQPAGRVGPLCTPAQLDRSAALAGGALTVSPAPGTRVAARVTQLSFLGAPAADISIVSVSGTHSGTHSGRLLAYSQGDGTSFVPDRPFVEGELVTVRAVLRSRSHSRGVPFSWSFVVAHADSTSHSLETPPPPPKSRTADYERFRSRPDLRPPTVTVGVDTGRQARGKLLLAPYAGVGQYGPMILDSAGRLVWFDPLQAGERAADLRVQEYEGRPVLTWWQDPLPYGGRDDAGIVMADSSYRTIAVIRAGNGYKADLHAFHVLPDGAVLTTVYDAVRCDLRPYGGPSEGALADTLVQEIDPKTGLVRFEWHSIDHIPLTDSYMLLGRRGGSLRFPWDWFHINAVSPQPDGRLLVNSRNTWASYEVDGHSGRVLWSLGGKRSSFAMGPAARTAWQHDASWQPNGTITFFDNGASPKRHSQSRGLVVRLDLLHMRATVVGSFVHRPALVAESQGDLQPLAGGDWLVGWGQEPYFSELAPDGKALFDAHLPVGFQSYTVFKAAWSAQPSEPPQIAVRRAAHGLDIYASWNGATEVARWEVLGGPSPQQLAPLASAARDGFETTIAVAQAPTYLAARALSASGAVLGGSAPVHRPVARVA